MYILQSMKEDLKDTLLIKEKDVAQFIYNQIASINISNTDNIYSLLVSRNVN